MRRIFTIVLLAASLAGAAWSRERLAGIAGPGETEKELLYLPNGKYLKASSLGYEGVVADAVYLWAIQYYADYERRDRYAYVEHVFGDVIAELDPHYVDPYWLGALILTMEKGDLEAGLRLLDKGFEKNPGAWTLPHLAGWECDRHGDHLRAAAYFERAAAVPGAPTFVRRLKAGMLRRAGDVRGALASWREVLDDPDSDATAREIAERQARDLQVRVDVEDLDLAVASYRAARGRNPASLSDLVATGLLRALPVDPDGHAYAYDARTGAVGSSAGRLLGRQG